MRRILSTAMLLFMVIAVNAQQGDYKFNRQTLSDYLRNYNYIKAKETADLALGFEEAKSDALIWYYAGNAYLHIHRLSRYLDFILPGMDPATVKAKMGREANRVKKDKKLPNAELWYYNYDNIEGMKTLTFTIVFENGVVKSLEYPEATNYPELGAGALQKSFEYYQTALALNKTIGNPLMSPMTAMDGMNAIAGQYYNDGVIAYNAKDFGKAAISFKRTSEVTEKYTASIDTFATENAAIAARLAQNSPLAIEMYQKLISLKYYKPLIFLNLGELYKAAGDTAQAFNYLEQGRAIFPDDFDLLIAQTNLFLNTNKAKEAQNNLMVAVAKDPNNANLYYVIGTQYFDMLKTLDFNKDTASYRQTFEMANEYLTKATELNATYFEALYNLGALYVNEGVRVFEVADKLDPVRDAKKYEAMKLTFEGYWEKARGYMERAHEQNPKDVDTVHTLRQLYARANNVAKVKEMDVKLKELGVK
jgi:tetratricopeptide (TPR) repeat protein